MKDSKLKESRRAINLPPNPRRAKRRWIMWEAKRTRRKVKSKLRDDTNDVPGAMFLNRKGKSGLGFGPTEDNVHIT